jgi:hypothetical protein
LAVKLLSENLPASLPGPRETLAQCLDANNPADWLWIAEFDLGGARLAATEGVAIYACPGKLAEVLGRQPCPEFEAAVSRTHSRRFAEFVGPRDSRQRLECGVFSPAFLLRFMLIPIRVQEEANPWRQPLTGPSDTLPPRDGERDGLRGVGLKLKAIRN